jgi:L-rhamnose mutarotase
MNYLTGMKNKKITQNIIYFIFLTVIIFSCQQKIGQNNVSKSTPEVIRVGMVIKIDSTRITEYLALHADSNAGVRDLLVKYHLRNFSIFMTQLDDGNYYEFGYYEYTGNNFEADMASLDAEPRNKDWLKICDPMQIPLKGEASWKKMKPIYFNN